MAPKPRRGNCIQVHAMRNHRLLALALTVGIALIAGPWLLYAIQRPGKRALAVTQTDAAQTAATTSTTTAGKGKPMSNFAKPPAAELEARLSPLQYQVTQNEGTEPPFQNEYWNEKRAGIYVDVVSGEPLFSSLDKYDSGTGWPSFSRPIDAANVATKTDSGLFTTRVEVRSKQAGSHLGHVFDDGPAPTGKRYCMNSAALRFVPVEKLVDEGYEQYLPAFEEAGALAKDSGERETALLAGGCFWGMEEILRKIPGVVGTEVGYTGGTVKNATYAIVKHGDSGHAEAVKVVFDPKRISFEQLLGWFFRMHDPTTKNRQGNDIGTSYRSSIFYTSAAQKTTAEEVRSRVDKSSTWKNPLVTEIVAASDFWSAEEYHQDYLEKNPGGYTCHYLRD